MKDRGEPQPEEQPAPEIVEPQIEAETPEDFEEPEGKSGKWGEPVKGEVEVEGKKVEVSYREKVIELPKHRQEETGIKRIRRRELLLPFPDGLFISHNNDEHSASCSSDKKFDWRTDADGGTGTYAISLIGYYIN